MKKKSKNNEEMKDRRFKWIHLGMLFDDNDEKFLIEINKTVLTAAGSKFQWNYIRGIEANTNTSINIVNSLPVETWPRNCKQLLIRSRDWSHCIGARDVNVGCINLPGVKQLCRFIGILVKLFSLWSKNEKIIISIYHYNLYILLAALVFRKVSHAKLCLIVPDLPNQYGIGYKKSGVKALFTSLLGKVYIRITKKMDMCVLLTSYMADVLGVSSNKYIVMEGFADIEEAAKTVKNEFLTRKLMYTGNLCEECRIKELIDAFERIEDESLELHLFGFGPLRDYCNQKSYENKKIIVHGVCSRKQLLDYQREAYLLINPRNDSDGITQFFFPSKTFEYMLSGRPMAGYFLKCFPLEYKNYFFVLQDSEDGLYKGLVDILRKPSEELNAMGMRAKEFVMKNKNYVFQTANIAKKMIGLFDEREDNE